MNIRLVHEVSAIDSAVSMLMPTASATGSLDLPPLISCDTALLWKSVDRSTAPASQGMGAQPSCTPPRNLSGLDQIGCCLARQDISPNSRSEGLDHLTDLHRSSSCQKHSSRGGRQSGKLTSRTPLRFGMAMSRIATSVRSKGRPRARRRLLREPAIPLSPEGLQPSRTSS